MDQAIKRIEEILPNYDLLLCDVWGVLHNGVQSWTQAYRALIRAREAGTYVVLITNSPRPNKEVRIQLRSLGVPAEAYDDIVTSGDVTQALIRQGAREVFHLGPERDRAIFDGLDVELADEAGAKSIVCTGLFDDESEHPDDYTEQLARFKQAELPFICANPDIVVERGERLIWCAGALARDYKALGGETLIAGKPHWPIYEEAIAKGEAAAGKSIDRGRVLAIGDGMPTDVKGAMDNQIDLLFVTDGIHAREYGAPGNPDPVLLAEFLKSHDATPVATTIKLA